MYVYAYINTYIVIAGMGSNVVNKVFWLPMVHDFMITTRILDNLIFAAHIAFTIQAATSKKIM